MEVDCTTLLEAINRRTVLNLEAEMIQLGEGTRSAEVVCRNSYEWLSRWRIATRACQDLYAAKLP